MTLLRRGTRLASHSVKNLAKVALRVPLSYPSLSSMTLDQDDVALARQYLRDRRTWDSDLVAEYETRFAEWNGSRRALAFASARVALTASIHALGLRPGDEAIVPGYTCVVVPNAFKFAGLRVVFADIELDSFGLDASRLEERVTPRTRVVVLQHLYGLVCRDYEDVVAICRDRGLAVIEDCAQATGAVYKGHKVGALGDVAVYSSECSKVYSTVQGGLAATNDERIADGLTDFYQRAPLPDGDRTDRQLHTLILDFYEFKHERRAWLGDAMNVVHGGKRLVSTTSEEISGMMPDGYGCRMSPPIAAIGTNQLSKVDRYNELRRMGARRWDDWCHREGYSPPVVVHDSVPVYLRYPVLVEPEKKRDTRWAEHELKTRVGVWFTSNLHPAPGGVVGCPNADTAVRQCVNLPTLVGASSMF